jgi:hypothetical protein
MSGRDTVVFSTGCNGGNGMDSHGFDDLTNKLASGESRRGVLRIGAGLLAAVAGIGIANRADARLRDIGQTCRDSSQCLSENCIIAPDGRRRCGYCEHENCSIGCFAPCGKEGECAAVLNADDSTSCVARGCEGNSCTSDADCDGWLCIQAPGCCGQGFDGFFCVPPCGYEEIGITSAGVSTSWR